MRLEAPLFWRRRGWQTELLKPLAAVYGGIADRRMRRPPRFTAPAPVVTVGNFTVGGAGKTPMSLLVADAVRALGAWPAIVTRGFGGQLRGPVRVDPARHRFVDVGDEALLMAERGHHVVVAADRAAGVRAALADGATLCVLDDGFQSRAVSARLNIVVVDEGYGVGNGLVLPAGPLRAPFATQIAAADMVVFVATGGRQSGGVPPLRRAAQERGIATFDAHLVVRDPAAVLGRPVIAYAGIGRPEKLAESLAAIGADVRDFVAFPDHHVYTTREAYDLIDRAAAIDATLVTTEKDAVRMPRSGPVGDLKVASRVLAVDLDVPDPVFGEALKLVAAEAVERA
jgi:tetraacyldisaccharide 4'-kinase